MDDLIAAIAASPDDDGPRLVWADREGGERGELVVLQCRIAAREGTRADRVRWQARVREILEREPSEHRYVRGFIEEVRVGLDGLDASLFDRWPLLRSLVIEPFLPAVRPRSYEGMTPADAWAEGSARFEAACAGLPVGRVQTLEVTAEIAERGDHVEPDEEHPFGDAFVASIAKTPAFAGLRELRVIGGGLTAAIAPHVAALRLTALRGGASLGGADAARLLSEAPTLRAFGPWNGSPSLHDVELATLLAAPATRELVELDLWANELADADLEQLAATPFRRLERLGVGMGSFSDRGVTALAASPYLAGLRDLDLYIFRGQVSPIPFLREPHALTHLRLGAIDDAIVAALEAAPALERVHIEPLSQDHLARLRATIPLVNDGLW
jgi:uncharacterized protein (TIGR02996 family)